MYYQVRTSSETFVEKFVTLEMAADHAAHIAKTHNQAVDLFDPSEGTLFVVCPPSVSGEYMYSPYGSIEFRYRSIA